MAHSTRPVPTIDYIGSQAGQIVNNAANQFQNAFDRIRGVLNSLGNALRAASYGLRQEVPFERWFYDHGFQTPVDTVADQMKARAWAVVATCEGAVRITAEAASYIFSLAMEPQDTHRHMDVLKAQLQGFSLSLLAVYSPNDAKAKAHNGGNPIIGSSLIDWKWGSLYTGKVDAPFWKVECRHYPWADRPSQ